MDKNMLLKQMKSDAELINSALKKTFIDYDSNLSGLADAEKYSLLAGGKRVRPIIAIAFCRMFGGRDAAALPYACALEMVHTASLIHDDLPCIDNDDLRRGRPTNHKVFGESTALLAGDGLLLDSFGLITANPEVPPEINAVAAHQFSIAIGTRGLVGGEYIDIKGETEELDLDTLLKMHACKTGALIRVSAILGALAAGVKMSETRMADAIEYAESIGLAFQIIDDVLDVTGTSEQLGKNPGQDAKENKTTFLKFYSVGEALAYAKELTERALYAVSKYENSEFLVELAKYLLERNN